MGQPLFSSRKQLSTAKALAELFEGRLVQSWVWISFSILLFEKLYALISSFLFKASNHRISHKSSKILFTFEKLLYYEYTENTFKTEFSIVKCS